MTVRSFERKILAEVPEWVRVERDTFGFWTTAAAWEDSPTFIREDCCIVRSEAVIDRAAQYLRETLQSGKKLNDWSTLPKSAKKKWIVLATGLLDVLASAPANNKAA